MNKLENLAKQLDELDDKFKLLNSSSNFLTYHILHALTAFKSQCFAADYAIHYAEHYKRSDEILLSMVSPGRSYIVKKGGEKYGQECESGYDSHISPESKEIVLFQSAQILPLFIIRFKRIPNAEITEEKY